MAKRGEGVDLPPFGVAGDCVEGPAAGLGDEVAELVGAHADRGSEVVDEHDAPLGGGRLVDEQLRAPAVALAAEGGDRTESDDVDHGEPPVGVAGTSGVVGPKWAIGSRSSSRTIRSPRWRRGRAR